MDAPTLPTSVIDPSEVLVGLIRAVGRNPEILEFKVGAGTQQGICSEPAALTAKSLADGPPEDIGEIAGFPSSPSCMGLELSAIDCDNVHLFWNTSTGHLDWCRR